MSEGSVVASSVPVHPHTVLHPTKPGLAEPEMRLTKPPDHSPDADLLSLTPRPGLPSSGIKPS